ncbi:hypothetical protein [Roseinatronobacter alkalisoli]|uniref:DUF3137 domain-containing protein n=1 Tax=Roseinatronobacter alkalisoli TaxID=3028235 RepID=A0ABT5TI00_9RHOB|nr:hypothetical protein [Roseinatronobacter sp. HJB301]MDD7973832.1 hypothetical protein [Roseinatronobacter sp. HJB301]
MRQISKLGATVGIAPKGDHAKETDKRLHRQSAELERAVAELEKLRRDICDGLDWRARLVLPLVPLAVIVLFIVFYGWSAPFLELPRLILLSAISTVVAWLLLQYRPSKIYRQTMRAIIGRSVAIALLDFTHNPEPSISKDKLRRWPLFPHVSAVEGIDLFKGQRGGHNVAICRLNINYHYKAQQRRESHRKSNLHAICIKLDSNLLGTATAVLLPGMIDNRIHKAITGKHGLTRAPLMQDFENLFAAYGASGGNFARRLEQLNTDALQELGQRERVILVFHDAQTIALFPQDSDIFVPFAPLSYWQKINTQELLWKISRDLAQMEDRLNMVLSLQTLHPGN